MIGDANQKYIMGHFEEAEELAKKIIKQYPDFTEPYKLLGTIYEEMKMEKQAAEYYFIASYMQPENAKEWEKIGYLYKSSKCYDSAGYCFGRALKSDTMNQELWKERANCYEMIGELKKSIKCLERILIMDDQNEEVIKKCAKLYLKNKNIDKSIEILNSIIRRDNEIKYNIVFMICEIILNEKTHQDLAQFLNNTFELNENDLVDYEEKLSVLPI